MNFALSAGVRMLLAEQETAAALLPVPVKTPKVKSEKPKALACHKTRDKNLKHRTFYVVNKFSGAVVGTFKYLAWAKKDMEAMNDAIGRKSYAVAEMKWEYIVK